MQHKLTPWLFLLPSLLTPTAEAKKNAPSWGWEDSPFYIKPEKRPSSPKQKKSNHTGAIVIVAAAGICLGLHCHSKKQQEETPVKLIRSFADTLKPLKKALDKHVVGQEEVLKSLATTVAWHFLKPKEGHNATPTVLLLIGPSGSGKTLIAKTIAEHSNVPHLFINATDISRGGQWKGDSLSKIIADGLKNCGPSSHQAVIVIDEFDKLSSRHPGDPDKQANNVIDAMFTTLEGNTSAASGGEFPGFPKWAIPTNRMLFILTGTFNGNIHPSADPIATQKALINYGISAEMVGRIKNTFFLQSHSAVETTHLLEHENSPLIEKQKCWKTQGWTLTYSKDALAYLASKLERASCGARTTWPLIDHILSPIEYEFANEQEGNAGKTFTLTEKFIKDRLGQSQSI